MDYHPIYLFFSRGLALSKQLSTSKCTTKTEAAMDGCRLSGKNWLSPAPFKLCNHTHKKREPFWSLGGKLAWSKWRLRFPFCSAGAGYLRTTMDPLWTNRVRRTWPAFIGYKDIVSWLFLILFLIILHLSQIYYLKNVVCCRPAKGFYWKWWI